MPLLLIFTAAFVHLVPHAALKGAADRNAFLWWMLLINAVCYAPFLWFNGPLSRQSWILVLASGVAEALYLFFMTKAYAVGDLSVVYPLSRGVSPLLLILSSLVLLHEHPTSLGIAGILVIAAGIYVVNLSSLDRWREPLRSIAGAGPRWALAAGAMTATYTTIDKVGVSLVHPFTYLYLALFVTFLCITPVMLATAGWGVARATFRASPWRTIIAGVTMPLAYVLVLMAMRMGMYASYAGSLREISVIVATIVGVLLFGERVTVPRVVGSVAIVCGIVLVALRG